MKSSLLSLFLLATFTSSGQDTTKTQIRYTKTRAVRTEMKEYTIVKDSTGKQLDYAVWKPLYDSGDFTFTKKEITDTTYTLKWFSPEMKKKQYENAPAPRLSPFFKNGEKIRTFKTKDVSGNAIDLDQYHGRIVVINFFIAGECAGCKREMAAISEVINEIDKSQPVTFLAITRYSKSEVEKFLNTKDSKYTIVTEDKEIAASYGIKTYPVYVVIDGEGIVRFHTYGTSPKNVDFIKRTINAIIKEKGASF
jgi:peroxiredoxin